MPLDDDGSIRIPLKIDTSGVEQDLRALDPLLTRLEQRLVKAFNTSDLVGGKGATFNRASSAADVQRALGRLPADQVRQLLPQVAAAQQALQAHQQAISSPAAQRGGSTQATAAQTTPTQQAQRMAAQQRMTTPTQANAKPMQIEGTPSFISKLAAANAKASPAFALYRNAGGYVGRAGRMGGAVSSAAELAMSNPYAAGGALLSAALIGGSVYENQVRTTFNQNQAVLSSALVGGPLLGNQRTMMGLKTSQISQDLSFDPKEVQGIVQTLGLAGVRQGDIQNNLRNVIALAGPNGLPTGDVTALAASLGMAGGQNNAQTNRTFQDAQNVAHAAKISLTELLGSMKALSSGAIGAAKDVGGLAAVQSIVGASSGISAGQFMAPVLGATGSQALQASALLGMSPQQLLQAQSSKGGTAQLFDRISGLVKRVDHGPAGTDVAESLLSSSGLVDTSNIAPERLSALIEGMRTASPDQASKLAGQLYKTADTQAVSQTQSYKNAADAMQALTTWGQRAAYMFENMTTQLFNQPSAPVPTKPLPGMTLDETRVYALSNPAGYARRLAVSQGRGGTQSGRTGAITYGPGTDNAQLQGIAVRNMAGGLNYANPGIVNDDLAAAKRNGVSAATLLAMQSQESGFNTNAVSRDGGFGLSQLTDAATARKYLHVKPGQDWHAAALDPKRAAEGQAEYLAALLKQSGGNEALALARYNGGTSPGAAAQRYGRVVEQNAQDVATRMDVHVDVTVHDTQGRTLPSTHRTVSGGKSYSPPPGLHHR